MFDSFAQDGFHHILVRIIPAAGILAILWTCESVLVSITASKWRHGVRNLLLSAINGLLLFFTLGFASIAVADYVGGNSIGMLNWYPLPVWLHLTLSFASFDLFGYLWHRVNHAAAILWRFHRVHHSDNEMDVTTSGRFHFVELAVAAFVRLPIIGLLGCNTFDLLFYETILVSVSMFHHSALRLGKTDALIRVLIVTPDMHRMHHSRDPRDSRSNYSSVLSCWDRLFGTHRVAVPMSLPGLDGFDDDISQSLVGLLRSPFMSKKFEQSHVDLPANDANKRE